MKSILLLSLLAAGCMAESFVIRGALVFDGEKTLGVRDVLVEAGKIAFISTSIGASPGTTIVEAEGKTLLPGLFDSHVHLGDESRSLRLEALFGVTTAIDLGPGSSPRQMRERYRKAPAGELADFRSAGIVVTVRGGHGTQYGIAIPTLDDPAEAQSFVDARIAEGSDLLKIMYEDSSGGKPLPRMSKEIMRAAIEAAHVRGKLAVVHAGKRIEHVRDAIEAGADGAVHSFFDSVPDLSYGQMFMSHRAFLMPTFPVQISNCALPDNEALGRDPRISPWLTETEARRLKTARGTPASHRDCAGSFASISILRDAGATILAGTDAHNPGTAVGASIHEEMEILVRCGLSPEQALTSATSAPARVWRLKDRGRIAPGLRADLLLIRGDATRDITSTRDITQIWLAGVAVDRTLLLEKIRTLKRDGE